MLYTEWIDHSLLLSGDADRPCSMFGRDFVVGGEDVVDGGDVVESAPSRAASALKAFVLDSSFFSFFLYWRCASPATITTVFSLRQKAS